MNKYSSPQIILYILICNEKEKGKKKQDKRTIFFFLLHKLSYINLWCARINIEQLKLKFEGG